MPGEINGKVHPTKDWTKISITRIPMGQGVAVTPLQMVMAMGAIANQGKLMMPQIVHSITDEHDFPIAQFPPIVVRQAVDSGTVKEVIPALEDVIRRGTAKKGAVDGYTVAGKTGTAQKVAPNGAGYMAGQIRGFVRGFSAHGKSSARRDRDAGQRHDQAGRELRRIGRRAGLVVDHGASDELPARRTDRSTNAAGFCGRSCTQGGPRLNPRRSMQLKLLLSKANVRLIHGSLDVDVRSISYDSRQVTPGTLFVALRGSRVDGHDHVPQAVAAGAVAVVLEEGLYELPGGVTGVEVPDTRAALAFLAAFFYQQPSQKLKVAGVTGTNGKTTTTYLLKHICERAMLRCGLIGTVRYEIGDEVLPSAHTTPESSDLQSLLARMRDSGCKAVAMEASSHAIAQGRISNVEFDAAVFTNLTQDHLDFHGTLARYFDTKASLFTELLPAQTKKRGVAVINIDDRYGAELCARLPRIYLSSPTASGRAPTSKRATSKRNWREPPTSWTHRTGVSWCACL